MKPREAPAPEAALIDRAKVRALLGEANALRESGVNLHHHPVMEGLGDLCGVMGLYVFAFTADDCRLDEAQLDAFADGLVRRAAP
jgi:hypothetical protein